MSHARSRLTSTGVRLTATALLCAGLLVAGASSASAVIVHLPHGKTLSYQPLRGAASALAFTPFDRFFSNLDYNGGPVMASNSNYTFYWDPAGAPSYPAEYQSGVNQYLEDLAHDSGGAQNVDSVSTQYNDAAGAFANYESHFAGAILDTDPYPANGCSRAPICLTDAQLQAELSKYVLAHGLPHDLAHEYFLLSPPGVEDCFEAAGNECSAGSSKPVYCAYHGSIPLAEGEIVYANDPYVTGNTGCDDGKHPTGKPSDGALQGGLSHEHNESITDPEPNNAWTDIGGSGGEVGDKCDASKGAALGAAPNGAPYNQVINGHEYWYQQEWSNQGSECLQRFTLSGAEPTASFTSTPGSGQQLSFDAGASTAPGGVSHYNWQFNDGPGLSTPTETTTPSVTHKFPEAGTYVVALTVFAPDGTSIGTAREVTLGGTSAPVVSKISPKGGPAAGGTSVLISGSGLSGASAVSFGASSASFTVNSDTSITAVAPASTSATVEVTVTTAGGTSATGRAERFKFGPATVTGVSPAAGPIAGGTPLRITGSGFALGSATTFAFARANAPTVNCTSSSSCSVVTPAAAKAGVVDVRAKVAGRQSAKNPPGDSYSYS